MHAMGNTLEVIERGGYGGDNTAIAPLEYARGAAIENPPGLLALKFFWGMIDHCGIAVADEVEHTISLSALTQATETDVVHPTVAEIRKTMRQLQRVIFAYSVYDKNTKLVAFQDGVLLDSVEVTPPAPD